MHAEYPAVSVIAKLSPDTAVESRSVLLRAAASTGGSKPRLYCHRSTQYIEHCVVDAIHAAARYDSSIVSIVLVLDTPSCPCNLG
jgi:hypothetical protein